MKHRSFRAVLLVATALVTTVAGSGKVAGTAHAATGRGAEVPEAPLASMTGDITFSVPSGMFADEISVEVGTKVSGAEIRYTSDGRPPTAESTLYSGEALHLTATTQLRVQSYSDGVAVGDPGAALYVASTVTTAHDIPVIVIDVYGAGRPSKNKYLDAAVMTFDPAGGGTLLTSTTSTGGVPTGAATMAARAGLRLRGGSSATAPKPGYRLEFRGNDDEDTKLPLLGMPAADDWALRTTFFDKALIRDSLAYGLGRDMGRVPAPRTVPCELYLNLDRGPVTAADYVGVYLASEMVSISSDRLAITKLKKSQLSMPEIQGGYVFKFDREVAEEPIIECTGNAATCWNSLQVIEPDPLQPEQRAWLGEYLATFNDVLFSDDFADPDVGYRAWIDVPSFVDYIIVNELSRNLDGYMKSAYFYKDRYGKLSAGPFWDYDGAWGSGGRRDNLAAAGWQYERQEQEKRAHGWIGRLMADPAFAAQVGARWRELRSGLLSDAALGERITTLTAPLAGAAERNFARWPNLTTSHLQYWITTPTMPTWDGQVAYLAGWVLQRTAWLDSQWAADRA